MRTKEKATTGSLWNIMGSGWSSPLQEEDRRRVTSC